jgi:hypothetical protein
MTVFTKHHYRLLESVPHTQEQFIYEPLQYFLSNDNYDSEVVFSLLFITVRIKFYMHFLSHAPSDGLVDPGNTGGSELNDNNYFPNFTICILVIK